MSTNPRTRQIFRKHRDRRQCLAAAIGAGLAALATAPAALADSSYTWNANNSGNFTSNSSWTGGIAPTGTSGNDTLIFGGTSGYVATLDNDPSVLPGFFFGNITFNNTSGIPSIQAFFPTGGGGLNLRVAGPQGSTINMLGAGDANIAVPIDIGRGSALTINVAAGAGQLAVANFVAGTNSLITNVLSGDGDVHVVNHSSNAVLMGDFGSLRGDFYVDAGTVIEADGIGATYPDYPGVVGTGGGDVIGNNNLIHVATGATFDFNANAETMSGITGTGIIRMGATGGMTFLYHSDMRFSGQILGPASGGTNVATGGVAKDDSTGGLVYTFDGGASSFTGNTTVSAGTMVLTAGAQFATSKTLVVNNGSTFVLDNTNQEVDNRFNAAGTATMTLGGKFSMLGVNNGVTAQKLAAITFNLTGAGEINVQNGAGGTATLTATNITRNATRGSYVDFTGSGAVKFTTAPTRTNGILPFATVNGQDWATIDTTQGNLLIPLSGTSYTTTTDSTTWATTANVRADSAVNVANASGTVTINSLKIGGAANTVTINPAQTLKLTGGGILAPNGGLIDGSSGTLVAGQSTTSADVLFIVGGTNTLTVNAAIGNNPVSGITKVGSGTLVLNNAGNTYAGTTRVFGGTLLLSNDGALGAAPGTNANVILSNGTLKFGADGITSNRIVQLNGENNVIDTNGHDVTWTNVINGNGDVTKTGVGNFIMSGSSGRFTSGGNLHVAQGGFTLGTGDLLGNGTIVTIDQGAFVDLSFDADGESAGIFAGAGQLRVLDTAGFTINDGDRPSLVFTGTIDPYQNGVRQAFGGFLTKTADGDIELSGASTYTGATTVNRGSITVDANVGINTPGPLGNTDTQILVGDETLNNFNSALYIGKPGVTISRGIVIQGVANLFNGTYGSVTLGASYTNGGNATFSGAISNQRGLELNAPVGARVDFTGQFSGLGSLTIIGGGTVSISNNTLSGGVAVNNSTLIITSDANLGGATNALNLNGGTLQTAGFSTSRTINLDSSGGTLSNTSTATPLTLTGTLNANGPLGKAGAGTVQLAQGGPLTIPGLAINAGTLSVSTGGPLTVTGAMSGAGALNVANGVTVHMQAPTTTVHSIGTLALNTSGTLDLGVNRLLTTNTPLSQVRSYLLQARNGGSWTGIGGITSSTVQASPITLGMAYFSGANPANATLAAVPGMTNPNAVFVRPAQIGDFNGDGVVDRFDIRQFNTRGAFNDGGTNHDWADGDLNNDGVVDRFDIRAFNTAGNFNNGVTFAAQSVAQSAAQPATLTTKASASPAVAPINTPTTVGLSGDGKPDLVYDPGTGDVVFKYDGFVPPASSPIVEMEIDSAKGSLRPNNASQTVAGSTTTSADGKLIDFANLGPTAIADGVDLGQIFPTGSNALLLTTGDISVSLFLYHDQTGSSYFADVVGGTAGVPEPTSLAFLGVAAAGLLGRRRKRRQK